MFFPFREVALMGGLLVVAVYSAFGFAALVERTDRTVAATCSRDPSFSVKSELPASAQDFVTRWDEHLKCAHAGRGLSPAVGPWGERADMTNTRSPLARNFSGTSAALWQSLH